MTNPRPLDDYEGPAPDHMPPAPWEIRQEGTMTCVLCGGNAGQMPGGRHNLCAARADLGLPTPSLGMRCDTCAGRGTTGRGGVPLMFDLGPATITRSIAAQFPPCPRCGGRGYTKDV